MQIISSPKEVNYVLHDLSLSIQRDFYAWDKWALWHIVPRNGTEVLDSMMQAQVTFYMRNALSGYEGCLINLEDGNTIILLRCRQELDATVFMHHINQQRKIHIPEMAVHVYTVRLQQEEILEILQKHIDPMTGLHDRHSCQKDMLWKIVPEVGNIFKTWAANCKLRQQRLRPHIMVVDDDPMTRHIVSRAIRTDYPIASAATQDEAIRKHFLLSPDIVFLDIQLGDGDGFTILSHIHNYDPSCRIIMFSANGYVKNKMRAVQGGASGFIEKPFKKEHFTHYIESWKQGRPHSTPPV